VAASAAARRAAPRPHNDELDGPRPVRQSTRRASRAHRNAVARAGLTKVAVVFVICLTALAVGRVALSFAVVQKSLETERLVRAERQVAAENARLAEDVAQRSSTVTIRNAAEHQLGLVDATHVKYLWARPLATHAQGGTGR
jgi:hypothetical protein